MNFLVSQYWKLHHNLLAIFFRYELAEVKILGVGEFQVCILLWWSMTILIFRIVTVIVDGVIMVAVVVLIF